MSTSLRSAAPRRRALLAGIGGFAGLAATPSVPAQETRTATTTATATATSASFPVMLPRTEFVYESIVDLSPTLQLGASPFGERRMVPITGGTFEGPGLRGKVLAGGADRQLVRRDGAVSFDAVYELQTDDGVIVSVRNRVLARRPPDKPPYVFSTLELIAPEGPYGWINDFVYVGTLNSLRPKRDAVVIRVYKVV